MRFNVGWRKSQANSSTYMKYFKESVTNGEWDEVESYLSGFSKCDEIFF